MKNSKKNWYPLYTKGKLDTQSEDILKQIKEMNAVPLSSLTPNQARKHPFESSWIGSPLENVNVKDLRLSSPNDHIPLRVYTPDGTGPYPIIVFFHGGGFVLGTLDEFDPFCMYLATGASCVVVSVDYRLAPEHKFPAAIEDSVTAVDWIADHSKEFNGDPERISVVGDSAGANLATIVTINARDKGFPNIIYQVLICPWVDSSSFNTDSFRFFGNGLWLSKANICWYRNHYLEDLKQATHPFVSPVLIENLQNLPPALVITAEFDVLRDQGEIYAHLLQNASVPVQCTQYKGMLHDFVVLPGLFDQAKKAIEEISTTLIKVFNT